MFALTSIGGCLASTAAACACSCCTAVTREAFQSSARLGWSLLFTFSLLISWLLRDFAKPLLLKIPWIFRRAAGTDVPSDDWFARQAVYRVSMGNFMLFAALGLIMALPSPVKYKSDWREKVHHSGWPIKGLLWIAANVLPFFFSNGVINTYSWFAKFGSPLFLGIQMLALIDMATAWNDSWVAEGENDENYLYALLGVTVLSYAGVVTLVGFMFHWFVPGGADCSLNVSIIVLGLLLCIVISALTFHPVIKQGNPGASIFPAACTSLYIMYLGFSALQSEPRTYECNALGQKINAASGTTLAAGMLLTLISVVYAAVRVGSSSQALFGGVQGGGGAEERLLSDEELTSAGLDGAAPQSMTIERPANSQSQALSHFQPVTYNYAQFYLIFALASLYIAMLMTGWGAGIKQKDTIDVGWASVWVKVVSQWAVTGLYGWTLVAPLVLPDREFM